MKSYYTFEITISPKRGKSGIYSVEAKLVEDNSIVYGQMRLKQQDLWAATADPQRYGHILYSALLGSDPILSAYQRAVGKAESAGVLGIRLRISPDASELHAIQWELLCLERKGNQVPLAISESTPFSRYPDTSNGTSRVLPVDVRPIRLLVAIANPANLPSGLPPIDVEEEIRSFMDAICALQQTKQFQVTFMPGRTGISGEMRMKIERDGYYINDDVTSKENILQEIKQHYHVLHFLGHGHFQKQSEQDQGIARLFLEQEDGTYEAVEDRDLTTRLGGMRSLPHLVFLASCESARRDSTATHPFVGLAPKLVDADVPAVIAMQDNVAMDLTRELVKCFYRDLLTHGRVDLALNSARAVLWKSGQADWAVPVLFTQLEYGQIFTPDIKTGPSQAPALPPHYVDRPEVSSVLRERLESRDLVVSAIHGLSGVGKSTQAAALAHDPRVRQRFPEGIFWTILGQTRKKSELTSTLSSWIHALGDNEFRTNNVEAASSHFRSLAEKKSILIVLDDAWDAAHVEYFRVSGSQCRTLITTREAMIATSLHIDTYDLDVMKPDQALELLSKRLGRALAEEVREDALRLAEIVGYLPLALELAAVQVGDGISWKELIEELSAEIARLEVLDVPEIDEITDDRILKRSSLIASFNLSLQRFLPEQRETFERFAWLGVLKEDSLLTRGMAATLWQTNEKDAQSTLRKLRNKALLLSDSDSATYHMHDLQRAMARRLLTASTEATGRHKLPGLGKTLQEAHETLLAHYKRRTQADRWYTLQDDEYILSHLTWHMQQAGHIQELHELLREEHETQNAWYQIQENQGQFLMFLEDVSRAWILAEQSSRAFIEHGDAVDSIALEFYYALVVTCLNTLASNLPPALLTELVAKRIWPPTLGLAYAQNIPEEARAEVFISLLKHVPPSYQSEVLQKATFTIQAIGDKDKRVDFMTRLVGQLVDLKDINNALTVAKSLKYTKDLAKMISQHAALFVELGYTEKVLGLVRGIRDPEDQANALIALVPHLSGMQRREAVLYMMETARKIKDAEMRAKVSAALAIYSSSPQKDAPLRKTLTLTKELGDKGQQAEILIKLIPHLSGPLQKEAVRIAKGVEDHRTKAKLLVELARNGAHSEQKLIFRDASLVLFSIHDEAARLETCVELFAYFPTEFHEELLQILNNTGDTGIRLMALICIAPYLPPLLKRTVLFQQVVENIPTVEDERNRGAILEKLVPQLSGSPQTQMLEMVRKIGDMAVRVATLANIAIGGVGSHRNALFAEVIGLSFSIQNIEARVDICIRIFPYLEQWQQQEMLDETIEIARKVKNLQKRGNLLSRLIPFLSRSQLLRAVKIVRSIGDQGIKTQSFLALQPERPRQKFSEKQVRLIEWLMEKRNIRTAFIIAWSLRVRENNVKPLITVALKTAAEYPDDALIAALSIDEPADRVAVLIKLLPHVQKAQKLDWQRKKTIQHVAFRSALEGVLTIEDSIQQTELILQLFPYSSKADQGFLVAELQKKLAIQTSSLLEIFFKKYQQELLEEPWLPLLLQIMQELPRYLRGQVADQILQIELIVANNGSDRSSRKPYFLEVAKAGYAESAWITAIQITDIALREEILIDLLAYIPEPLKDKAVEVLLTAEMREKGRLEEKIKQTTMAVNLTKAGHYAQALIATEMVADASLRLEIFVTLLPLLPGELVSDIVQKALVLIRQMSEKIRKMAIFVTLFPYMPEGMRKGCLEEILRELREVDPTTVEWVELALSLLPHLQEQTSEANTEALALVKREKNAGSRTEMFSLLTRSGYVEQALAIAQLIEDVQSRIKMLISLFPWLSEKQLEKIIPEMLSAVAMFKCAEQQVNTLLSLVRYASEPLKSEIIREIRIRIGEMDGEQKLKALTLLMRFIPEEQREIIAGEMLAALETEKIPGLWSQTLEAWLSFIPETLQRRIINTILTIARTTNQQASWIEIVLKLLPGVLEPLKQETVELVYEFASTIADETQRIEILVALLVYLPEHDRSNIVRGVIPYSEKIDEKHRLSKLLIRLIPHLSSPIKEHIVHRARGVINRLDTGEQWAEATLSLLPYLAEPPQDMIIQVALDNMEKQWSREYWLSRVLELFPRFSAPLKGKLLQKIFSVIFEEKLPSHWLDAVLKLQPYLSPEHEYILVEELCCAIKMELNAKHWIGVVIQKIPHMAKAQRETLLAEALEINWRASGSAIKWIRIGMHLLSFLSEPHQEMLVQEARTASHYVKDVKEWGEALLLLLPHLPEPLRCNVDEEALLLIRKMAPEVSSNEVLNRLALHGYSTQALAITRLIKKTALRVEILLGLLIYLPEDIKVKVLQDTHSMIKAIKTPIVQVKCLIQLLPYSTPSQKELISEQALTATQRIGTAVDWAEMLLLLLPYLPGPLSYSVDGKILEVIRGIGPNADRGEVLSCLARSGYLSHALAIIGSINIDEVQKVKFLTELLSSVHEDQKSDLVEEILSLCRVMDASRQKAKILLHLIPHTSGKQKEDLIAQAQIAINGIDDTTKWAKYAFSLLPYLPGYLSYPVDNTLLINITRIGKKVKKSNRLEILMQLVKLGFAAQAVAVIRTIENSEGRIHLWMGITSSLPVWLQDVVIHEVLQTALTIEDVEQRAKILSPWTKRLTKSGYLHKDNTSIQAIDALTMQLSKMNILFPIAQWGTFLPALWKDARSIQEELKRADVMHGLAMLLSELSPNILYPFWNQMLHAHSTGKRQDLLIEVNALTPVIITLGGEKALEEFAHVIRDVGRWWP